MDNHGVLAHWASSLQEFLKLLFRQPGFPDGVFQETDLDLPPSRDGQNATVRHLDVHMIALPASLDTPGSDEGFNRVLPTNPPELAPHSYSRQWFGSIT